MTISEHIKNLRKEQNLSQEDLAKKLFISRQAVSLWELGESVPSIDNLLMLKKLYNISIDEWLCDDVDSNNISTVESKNIISETHEAPLNTKKWCNKTIAAIACIVLIVSILLTGSINLAYRSEILYPLGEKNDYNITELPPIIIKSPTASPEQLIFENQDFKIKATLPDRFTANEDLYGSFNDVNGNFIMISTLVSEEKNPIKGSKADQFFNERNITSYISRSLYALSADISDINIFSSSKDLHIAGAVRILRNILGVENSNYSEIFMENQVSFTTGFAIEWDYNTWAIFLQLQDDVICNIFVRDQEIANNPDSLSDFLSTLEFDVKSTVK